MLKLLIFDCSLKVTVFGGSNAYYAPAYGQSTLGHYYQPTAATSRVQSTRLIVPQTSQIFRYQQYNNAPRQQYNNAPQSNDRQFNGQNSYRNSQGRTRLEPQNSQYGSSQYQDQNNGYNQNQYDDNFQGQNNRRVYAGGMPYTNNGEQVKLRRYRIHRPGIKKEFYDVEERTIIRPAGSALIELDPPSKKQDITDYQPYRGNLEFSQGQFNSQKGGRPFQGGSTKGGRNNNGNIGGFGGQNGQNGQNGLNGQNGQNFNGPNDNVQYFIVDDQSGFGGQVPDCGYGGQVPVNEYGPPATNFGNNQPQTPQYHPTTFAPPTNGYPTTTSSYPTSTGSYPTTAGTYPTTSSYPTTANDIPNQTYLPPYGSTDQSVQSTTCK